MSEHRDAAPPSDSIAGAWPATPVASREPSRMVVACLGSSGTAGRGQAFDWIGVLQRRPGSARFDVRNFGVGGDLAEDTLRRLPEVLACHPQAVIIWVGGNDVLARVFPALRRFLSMKRRRSPRLSSDDFRESLAATVRGLRAGTAARIAICSLPPIGEAPLGADRAQAELNRLVAGYSRIIAEIAATEGCAYIPLHEELSARIAAHPGRPFTAFRFLAFYRDAFRVLVLRWTPDQVAERNGWRFHSDGIHLNSRAGLVGADLIEQFLKR